MPEGGAREGRHGLRREVWTAAVLSLIATYFFFCEYLPPFKRVYLWSDIAGYHYPLHLYAFQTLKEGRFPEWDPSIYCGISYIGNIQAAPLYPMTWLMYAAAWSSGWFPFKVFEAFTFLHVWIAFLLCYLWLRDRAGRLASALGAMAFACGGFMMHQLLHPGVVGALAWLPLGLWGIDQAARGRDWLPLWKVSAASTLSFLAGYPAAWIVNCAALLLYAAAARPWWNLWRVCAALGASLALAAAQLLPSMEARSLMAQEFKYGPGAYGWRALVASYFTPNYFDYNPGHATTYEPGCFYFYLGVPAFFGLIWAAWRRRPRPYLPALVMAAGGLALANPPHWFIGLISRLPPLNTTMQPFQFHGAVAAAAALVAAISVEDFLAQGKRGEERNLSWKAGFAIGALGAWAGRQLWIWVEGGRFAAGWQSAVEMGLLLVLFAAGMFCLRAGGGRVRTAMAVVLLAAVAVDYRVYGSGRWFNAMEGDVDKQQPVEGIGGVDDAAYREMQANRHYRVISAEGEGPAGTEYRRWGLATPEGFDPFLPAQYKAAIEQWVLFHTNRLFHTDWKNREMMQTLGVRYALARNGSAADQKLAADPDYRRIGAEDIFCRVYEYRLAKPPFRWEKAGAEATVRLVKWEPARREFDLDSPQGGRFVLAEQFFPGWQATVDGLAVKIERAGGAFQSVELGPGRHHLVFEFGSRGFRLGLGISFAALLACVAVAMKARRRKKPRGMFDSLAEL